MLTEELKKKIWDLFLVGTPVRKIERIVGVPKSTNHDFIIGKTHANWPGRGKKWFEVDYVDTETSLNDTLTCDCNECKDTEGCKGYDQGLTKEITLELEYEPTDDEIDKVLDAFGLLTPSDNGKTYLSDGPVGLDLSFYEDMEFEGFCSPEPKPSKSGNTLVFGCAHLPYQHELMFPFLQDLYDEYRCDNVVCLGDLGDFQAMKFHVVDPDLPSAGDEVEDFIEQAGYLAEMFPDMHLTLGNHDKIAIRKMQKAGLSSVFLKSFNELLQCDWNISDHAILDDVLYRHQGPLTMTASKAGMSVIQGHWHSKAFVSWHQNVDGTQLFSAQCPCLIDKGHPAFAYGLTGPEATIGAMVVMENGRLPLIHMLSGA